MMAHWAVGLSAVLVHSVGALGSSQPTFPDGVASIMDSVSARLKSFALADKDEPSKLAKLEDQGIDALKADLANAYDHEGLIEVALNSGKPIASMRAMGARAV